MARPSRIRLSRGAVVSIVLTGTVTASLTEAGVAGGGKTAILSLTGDTWASSGASFDAQRQAIVDGLTSSQAELLGWNNEVRDKEVVSAVVRTSDTVATITFSAASLYNITAQEEVQATVPASSLITSTVAVVATPSFTIDTVATAAPLVAYYYRTLLGGDIV